VVLVFADAIDTVGDARVTPEVAADCETAAFALEGSRNCADDRVETDAVEGLFWARPYETAGVEGFDELAEEKGVAVVLGAGGRARGELVEGRVQDGNGFGDEGLALLVDVSFA